MKTALVLGCAKCVWDDVERAEAMCSFDKIYCVKLMGVEFPRKFDVWVTLHPEWMEDYVKQRQEKGYPDGYEIVGPPPSDIGAKANNKYITRHVSYRWKAMSASASSGIYGAKVALDDGAERVVLAGIPMDNSSHFTRKSPWTQRDSFMPGYGAALPMLKGKVKSMSGITRMHLGEPTPDWLGVIPSQGNSAEVQA